MTVITAAVGAAGTWDASTTTTWIGGVAPTQTDDVLIPLATTSITIGVGAVCRSVDFNTFTGTITQGSTGTLTIGDAAGSVPASNIAIRLPAGATYAPNSASTITFISTSATQQTISISNSYTCGNIKINCASNGNYALIAALTTAAASTVTVVKGTLHADGATDNSGFAHSWGKVDLTGSGVTKAFNAGAATYAITGTGIAWNASGSGLTFTCGTSVITMSGASSEMETASQTFNEVKFTGSGDQGLYGTTPTFAVLRRIGTAVKTDAFHFRASITVTGTLELTGNSVTNRLLAYVNPLGTQITITNTSTTMTLSNVDFRDIQLTVLYDASAITGLSGDCGGNGNKLTLTTGATQTATGTPAVSTNWSALTWSGRVPLPQDNATINTDLTTGGGVGIIMDMPRSGKDIDFTGCTLAASSSVRYNIGYTITHYGNYIMKTAMGTSFANTPITFEGRGSHTITSNGWAWLATSGSAFTIASFGGSYTLLDALNVNGNNNAFVLANGTFNDGGFSTTCQRFSSAVSVTRALTISGTFTVASDSSTTVWDTSTVTGLTITATGSTLVFTGSSVANTHTFNAGTAQTFGAITFSGKNFSVLCTTGITFNGVFALNNIGDTAGVKLQITRTYTLNYGMTTTASSGNVAKLVSATPASVATVTKPNGQICLDRCTITDITATGGAGWYAGANSTLSNASGWSALTCPFKGNLTCARQAINRAGTY
jgi:hypothetical protein